MNDPLERWGKCLLQNKCVCLHRDVMGGVSALAICSLKGLPTLPTQEKAPWMYSERENDNTMRTDITESPTTISNTS